MKIQIKVGWPMTMAGAIVDLAYAREENPRVAVEVLLGHGYCYIIAESSVTFTHDDVEPIVERIAGKKEIRLVCVPQDIHLADNQSEGARCGDNGIFKGSPITEEQYRISAIAHVLSDEYKSDGKYILDGDNLVICQSNASSEELRSRFTKAVVNPLGDWTGGSDVDAGATNRKLGSDMGDAVTGGGLHGKDCTKADVSVNIYCHFLAQKLGKPVYMRCAIGDSEVNGIPYKDIVDTARGYIKNCGGFEKFAEWGLF